LGGANKLTVTTQERKNMIHSCTSEQALVKCLVGGYNYFAQDIPDYLDVIKKITPSRDNTELVYTLLGRYTQFPSLKLQIMKMLEVYFNKVYEYLLFTWVGPNKSVHDDFIGEDYWKANVYFPIMIALLNDLNREKYPVTENRQIFLKFTLAVFNAFIPCDCIDVAYLIGGAYDVTKPDHNMQCVYDQIAQSDYDPSITAELYVSMFESKLHDIWTNDVDKMEFISECIKEFVRKANGKDYGTKCREIADRFIKAFPDLRIENKDEFVIQLFFLYADLYDKYDQSSKIQAEYENSVRGDIFKTFGILFQRRLDDFNVPYLEGNNAKIIKALTVEFDKYFSIIYEFTFPGQPIVDKILAGDTSYRDKQNNDVYANEAVEAGDPNVRLNTKKTNTSSKLQSAQATIYHAYKNYKNNEKKVDSQISKMVDACKRLAIGDVRTEIIEGKKFSAIGLLKKALGTAAIFAFGPIKGLIALVVRYALKKKTTTSERRKILTELQVELDMVTEKIEDAKGDGNREAKYAMMRTQAELKAAIAKVKYGLEVDERNIEGAKNALGNAIGVNKRRGF